jgi:hypothetical protein
MYILLLHCIYMFRSHLTTIRVCVPCDNQVRTYVTVYTAHTHTHTHTVLLSTLLYLLTILFNLTCNFNVHVVCWTLLTHL